MKKIFSIISASMAGIVFLFLITLSFIKTNVTLVSNNPVRIMVYNESSTATVTNGYTKDDAEYSEILKNVKKVSSISIFTRLVNNSPVKPVIEQDLEGKFADWSTEIKLENIVIELIYDKAQDLIVYVDGDTRVITYFCLAIVVPANNDFSDVVIYYSETNNTTDSSKDESYKACNPLTVKGKGGKLLKYLNSV